MILREKLHLKKFVYPTKKFPFKEDLEKLFGIEDLELSHQYLGKFDIFDQSRDQNTILQKVFYAHFKNSNSSFREIYINFINNFIANVIPYKFYYQAIPNFRIGLPNNKFVGEFHKDSQYNHQPYEINFNLAIVNYKNNACLFSEDKPGSDSYVAMEIDYGEVISFDHIGCFHGCHINTTGKTLMSIDFRLALADYYFEDPSAISVNLHSAFRIGDYFSNELVNK